MHLGFKRNCVCVFTVWSVAVFKACSVVCDSGKVIGYDHWFVSEVLQRSNTRCRLFHIARMGHNTDNTLIVIKLITFATLLIAVL